MGWESIVYKRADLFEKVWVEPVMHVAKGMGISGVALAKICRRMGIPLPGRGYWARKAAGKAPSRPQLRPPKPGAQTSYVQQRYVGKPGEVDLGQEIRAEVERQAQAEPQISVSQTLLEPHPLVARSSAILLKRKRRLDAVRSTHRCLDVSASGEALDRALRVMDALLKALESRGYTIEVTKPEDAAAGTKPARIPSRTLVHVADSTVQIGIDEAIDKIPLPLPEPRKPRTPYEYVPRPTREYEYKPTGRLRLRIKDGRLRGAPEVWSDRKGKKIESCLNEFVASVAVAAERQRLDRIEAERERRAAIARERRNKAIELHNDAVEVLREDLKGRLKDWRSAKEIEAFANAVRARKALAGESVSEDSPVGRWLEWASVLGKYLEEQAIGRLLKLREPKEAYQLRGRFGWSHKLTTDDVLGVFFAPIDELAREQTEDEGTE